MSFEVTVSVTTNTPIRIIMLDMEMGPLNAMKNMAKNPYKAIYYAVCLLTMLLGKQKKEANANWPPFVVIAFLPSKKKR
jgi:hypothetical protein